jgi:hypothetical protein
MKAKIVRGQSFAGVLRYVLDVKPRQNATKHAVIVGGNTAGRDQQQLLAEFQYASQQRPDIQKPVWHASLSLPQAERLDDATWRQVTDRFMQQMGFLPEHPFVVVRHQDTDFDHVHIVACRVSMLGKVWLGQWEARQAIGITQQLEQDFQLTQTKGLKNKKSIDISVLHDQPLDNQSLDSQPQGHQPPACLTSAEIQRSIRTGQAPVRQVLQQLIQQALTQPSWSGVVSAAPSAHTPISAITFCQRLQRLNVQVEPNIAPSTGRLNGFSFMYQGIAFKGSQVGYSLNTLIKHGLHYDPAQDAARLRCLTDQRQPTDQLDPDESTDRPAHPLDAIVSRTAAATANTAQRFDDRARLANQFAHDVRQLKDIIDHTNEHAANAARHAAETTKRIDQVLERLTTSAENANTNIRATARQLDMANRAHVGQSQQNGRTDVTSTQSTDAGAVQSGPDCVESSPNCAKSSSNIHEAATQGIGGLQHANPRLSAAIKQFRAPYEQLDRLIQQQFRIKQQANAEQKELMDMIRQHKKTINESNRATSIQRIYNNWAHYRDRRHEKHFEYQQKRFTEILDDIECMATNRREHYQFLKDQIMIDRYWIASTRKMAIEQCARLERQEKAFERWFSQLKQQMSPAPIRHHIYQYIKEIKRTMDQVHQSWQSITGRRYANGQPILQYSQADIDTYWQSVEKLTNCPHRLQSLRFGITSLLLEGNRYEYQEQEFKMLKKIVDRGHETLNGIMTYDQRPLNNEENEWIVHYRIKIEFLEKMHQGMPMYQKELKELIKYGFYQPVQPTVHVQPAGARSSSPEPYQRPSWL